MLKIAPNLPTTPVRVFYSPGYNFSQPIEQTVIEVNWKTAQAIAKRFRIKGVQTHVCTLTANKHVLWGAK